MIGNWSVQQLLEFIRDNIDITSDLGDLSYQRGPNGEILLSSSGSRPRQCFVYTGTTTSGCVSCGTLGNAIPLTFRDGKIFAKCCDSQQVDFLYLSDLELSCLTKFDCGGLEGETCLCSLGGQECPKCFIFCAEQDDDGNWVTLWNKNAAILLRACEDIPGILEPCEEEDLSEEDLLNGIEVNTCKCKKWCFEARVEADNRLVIVDGAGEQLCSVIAEKPLDCVYCCVDVTADSQFFRAVILDPQDNEVSPSGSEIIGKPVPTGVKDAFIGCGQAEKADLVPQECRQDEVLDLQFEPLDITSPNTTSCVDVTLPTLCKVMTAIVVFNRPDIKYAKLCIRDSDGEVINEVHIDAQTMVLTFQVPDNRQVSFCVKTDDCFDSDEQTLLNSIQVSSFEHWCRQRIKDSGVKHDVLSVYSIKKGDYFFAVQDFACNCIAISSAVGTGAAPLNLPTKEVICNIRCNEKSGLIECQKREVYAPDTSPDLCDGEEQTVDDFVLTEEERTNQEIFQAGDCECWCVSFSVMGMQEGETVQLSFGLDSFQITEDGEQEFCSYVPKGSGAVGVTWRALRNLENVDEDDDLQIEINDVVFRPVVEERWEECLGLEQKEFICDIRKNEGKIQCKKQLAFVPKEYQSQDLCDLIFPLEDVTFPISPGGDNTLTIPTPDLPEGCDWCLKGDVELDNTTLSEELVDGLLCKPLTSIDEGSCELTVTLVNDMISGSVSITNLRVERCTDPSEDCWEDCADMEDCCDELREEIECLKQQNCALTDALEALMCHLGINPEDIPICKEETEEEEQQP